MTTLAAKVALRAEELRTDGHAPFYAAECAIGALRWAETLQRRGDTANAAQHYLDAAAFAMCAASLCGKDMT